MTNNNEEVIRGDDAELNKQQHASEGLEDHLAELGRKIQELSESCASKGSLLERVKVTVPLSRCQSRLSALNNDFEAAHRLELECFAHLGILLRYTCPRLKSLERPDIADVMGEVLSMNPKELFADFQSLLEEMTGLFQSSQFVVSYDLYLRELQSALKELIENLRQGMVYGLRDFPQLADTALELLELVVAKRTPDGVDPVMPDALLLLQAGVALERSDFDAALDLSQSVLERDRTASSFLAAYDLKFKARLGLIDQTLVGEPVFEEVNALYESLCAAVEQDVYELYRQADACLYMQALMQSVEAHSNYVAFLLPKARDGLRANVLREGPLKQVLAGLKEGCEKIDACHERLLGVPQDYPPASQQQYLRLRARADFLGAQIAELLEDDHGRRQSLLSARSLLEALRETHGLSIADHFQELQVSLELGGPDVKDVFCNLFDEQVLFPAQRRFHRLYGVSSQGVPKAAQLLAAREMAARFENLVEPLMFFLQLPKSEHNGPIRSGLLFALLMFRLDIHDEEDDVYRGVLLPSCSFPSEVMWRVSEGRLTLGQWKVFGQLMQFLSQRSFSADALAGVYADILRPLREAWKTFIEGDPD